MSETETPVIDEASRKALATGKLFQGLAADPKYRPRILGILKEADPTLHIPELEIQADVERRVSDAVKPTAEENAALRKRIDDLETGLNRERSRIAAGLEEDELVEVETLAKDGKIGDFGTAVEHYRLKQTALGTPRATRDPGADEYRTKLRKINPRDGNALKRAAIEEGTRIVRGMRRTG